MDKVLLELLVRIHDFIISKPVNKTSNFAPKLKFKRDTTVRLTIKI